MIFKREIRLKRNFLVCRADTLITMRNAVFFKSSIGFRNSGELYGRNEKDGLEGACVSFPCGNLASMGGEQELSTFL